MRKAALHNLGCKVNSYETEAMQQLLEEAGYEIVPFAEGADVYIINTCSVTNIADRKSRQMLHRAKKMNPQAVVVAAGCYVQSAGEALKLDEAVDLVIGNNKKTELVRILDDYFANEDHTVEETVIDSYCIIPYTRGRVRSRKLEDVRAEVERLVEAGYKEIVLTGIHLSSYGVDFEEGEKKTLLDLIVCLHEAEGLLRIRLGSLEPRIITKEFAEALTSLPKICPHFHLSLQSGCDATLARMNRHYTTEDYLSRCEILRAAFDCPAITTDVIVGFPGETEEEFQTTEAFLKAVHFYEMHVFKYSKREGTRAAVMPSQIPEPVKTERSGVLLSLEKEMSLEYRKQHLGKTTEVLMEEEFEWEGKRYMIGHTKEYIKAAVPFQEDLKGSMISGILETLLNDEVFLLKN